MEFYKSFVDQLDAIIDAKSQARIVFSEQDYQKYRKNLNAVIETAHSLADEHPELSRTVITYLRSHTNLRQYIKHVEGEVVVSYMISNGDKLLDEAFNG